MPRADFYLIAKPRFRAEPLRLVCELARKAHDAGTWTLILARDAEQAEMLDDMLWDMGEDAYIPHQIAGSDIDEEEAAVLIAPPDLRLADPAEVTATAAAGTDALMDAVRARIAEVVGDGERVAA